MFTNKFFQSSVALSLGLSAISFAQETIPQKPQVIEEVVVTASKYPQKQTQTGKVMTVISKEILERSTGKSLTELLNQQVGITVIGSQNNLGTNQEIYMRGAATGYTLILLNGTPIYDPSNISNSFDLNLIPLDQIERIEILKGGHSTMYGSDALAGVINVITKKGGNTPIQGTGSASVGTYDTFKINAGIGGQINKTNYSLQVSTIKSKGFSTASSKNSTSDFEKDGFSEGNLMGLIEHQLSDNLILKLTGSSNSYTTDLDAGAFTDDKDYTLNSSNLLYGTGLIYHFGKGKLNLNFTHNSTERVFVDDSTSVPKSAFSKYQKSSFIGNSDFIEAYSNINLSEKLDLLVGLENRWQNTAQDYLSVSAYGKYVAPPLKKDKTQTTMFSAYTSFILKNTGIFGMEIGGRLNNHSVFGANFTYSLNPYLLVNQKLKIFANYSSSFKAPSQYQLFSPYGTPDLKPENGVNFEFGTQVFSADKKSNLRVVYFQRKVKDLIYFQSLDTDPYGKYVNLNQQNDSGLEIDGQLKVGDLTFSANYTFVDGNLSYKTQSGKDTTQFNLFRRPKNTFNANLNFQVFPEWNVQLSCRSVSVAEAGTYDDKSVKLGGYTVLDFYQEFKANETLKFFFDLKNIGNVTYFDLPGYNTRGVNMMMGLSAKF
jgi:vitamin B12 transporter